MPSAPDTTLTFPLLFCCFSGRRRARTGLTTEDGAPLNFSALDIVGDVAESAIRLMLLVCVRTVDVSLRLCGCCRLTTHRWYC